MVCVACAAAEWIREPGEGCESAGRRPDDLLCERCGRPVEAQSVHLMTEKLEQLVRLGLEGPPLLSARGRRRGADRAGQ